MCGRFAVDKKPEEIAAEVEALWDDEPIGFPSWNTCPTGFSPVLFDGKLHSWSWGLIPSWAQDEKRRGGLINARLETLVEKPSFKNLLGRRQCVIPCDGYFEWLRDDKTKIPYYFHSNGPQMLLMAGLWDEWRNRQGEVINSFTVITRDACESIAEIHHRMPILLNLDDAKGWSSNVIESADLMDASLQELQFHQVSKDVNSVRNNHSRLIVPTDKPQYRQQDLF
jgi:putative SOS response-associated peptidase YedK